MMKLRTEKAALFGYPNWAAYTVSEESAGTEPFELQPWNWEYHPDVRVYEVKDANGTSIGLYLLDPYAREDKVSPAVGTRPATTATSGPRCSPETPARGSTSTAG